MAEVKRRNKSPETGEDKNGEAPPRRQTRVTLTQDVSSRYRKIMPKSPASPRPRKPADGTAPPASRGQKSEGDGSGPPPRRRSGTARGSSSREDSPRRTTDSRSGTVPRRTRPAAGGSSRDETPRRGRPARGSSNREESPRRTGSNSAGSSYRPTDRRLGHSPRPAKNPRSGGQLELRIILDRELPEAAKQVTEIQAMILNAANDLISLIETLEQGHAFCTQCLSDLTWDKSLTEVVQSMNTKFDEALKIITVLYEKISFQDLAGQRLAKVEMFLKTLSTVLTPLSGTIGRPSGRSSHPAGTGTRKEAQILRSPARDRYAPESVSKNADKKGKKALKGPQAPGEGADQAEIDRLMNNL